MRTLAVLYPNHMHAVTVEGSGISKIEDLKGKRISTGSPGSATEVFAFRVLEAAGLDHAKDITKERLGAAESVNALKDRKIEAFFWVGGLPTAAVTDLAATPNTAIKFLDVAHLTEKMNAKYGPLYTPAVIPKETYSGMDKDAHNITVWNILAVNENMPEDLAYAIAKVLFEKRNELALVHARATTSSWRTRRRREPPGSRSTPAAAKYLKEKGVEVRCGYLYRCHAAVSAPAPRRQVIIGSMTARIWPTSAGEIRKNTLWRARRSATSRKFTHIRYTGTSPGG